MQSKGIRLYRQPVKCWDAPLGREASRKDFSRIYCPRIGAQRNGLVQHLPKISRTRTAQCRSVVQVCRLGKIARGSGMRARHFSIGHCTRIAPWSTGTHVEGVDWFWTGRRATHATCIDQPLRKKQNTKITSKRLFLKSSGNIFLNSKSHCVL